MTTVEQTNLDIARRWCESKGAEWSILDTAGRGGTAPVFSVASPDGTLALKLLDEEFSTGKRGEETERRVLKQVQAIGRHDCPYLVQIYDGGRFEGRLFLLMNKAPGSELALCLDAVPRNKISVILDQITQACIFLRDRNLTHRDIKSANIFVTDDFSHATLLDVSVARDIYDPVGLGTDNNDQLPVVATSRYTPPEYLFRLLDPGYDLWNAVDLYQLGGLLHDLIMRKLLFESEYQKSKENRYRFAWVVATQTPMIDADDVEPGLLLLARRALDKDWQRRSQLALDDFLAGKDSQRRLGLSAIGFAPVRDANRAVASVNARQLVASQATSLEEQIRSFQIEKGIRATHTVRPGKSDLHKVICFSWDVGEQDGQLAFRHVELSYELSVETAPDDTNFALKAHIRAVDGEGRESSSAMSLPPVPVNDDAPDVIYSSAVSAIGELASALMQVSPSEGN